MRTEKRNGGYRVQKQKNGKRYSFTFDHKPTKADIENALADAVAKENALHGCDMTFLQASKNYIENKKNVLSASTLRSYETIMKNLPDWFNSLNIYSINQNYINRIINEIAIDKSPKTVRNYHGFISAVLGVYNPALQITTKLPQKIKKEIYIPNDDDVKKIIEASKGTRYYVAVVLMCYGLRRSELLAITGDDVDGDCIHINKAIVVDSNNDWIVKTTKTTESTRDIYVPLEIAEQIQKDGYAYNGHPDKIREFLYRTQDKLGLKRFSMHKMRHYFASKMSQIGVPDADIMALGGWKTDNVMKTVYRHSLQTKEQKKKASDQLTKAIFE